jgi:hypothetical protein
MLPGVVLADLTLIYEKYLCGPRESNPSDQTAEPIPRDRVTSEDLQRWSAFVGKPTSEICDQIAVFLARGFHDTELTYDFCDAVANDVWRVMITGKIDWSDLLARVYDAFDAGEWVRSDRPEEDPVEVYTRPAIAEFVAGLPASG